MLWVVRLNDEGLSRGRMSMASGSTGLRPPSVCKLHTRLYVRLAELNPLMRPKTADGLARSNSKLHPQPNLQPRTDNVFASDLCCEFSKVGSLGCQSQLDCSAVAGASRHRLRSFQDFEILVPAWSGRPGHMEFPGWRVTSRKAAILHELFMYFSRTAIGCLRKVSLFTSRLRWAPTRRFQISAGRCTNSSVNSASTWCPAFRQSMSRSASNTIQLAEMDAIATPSPLTLKVGNRFLRRGAARTSAPLSVAGSFIQFLIETRGLADVSQLYERTPLVPLQQNAGSPDAGLKSMGIRLGA